MPRLMSVSLTEQAVRERRKTVTRRLGWRHLRPGDRLTLCRKVMGRKPGEPLIRICDVEVLQVVRQPLSDVRLELHRRGVIHRRKTGRWYLYRSANPETGQPIT